MLVIELHIMIHVLWQWQNYCDNGSDNNVNDCDSIGDGHDSKGRNGCRNDRCSNNDNGNNHDDNNDTDSNDGNSHGTNDRDYDNNATNSTDGNIISGHTQNRRT